MWKDHNVVVTKCQHTVALSTHTSDCITHPETTHLNSDFNTTAPATIMTLLVYFAITMALAMASLSHAFHMPTAMHPVGHLVHSPSTLAQTSTSLEMIFGGKNKDEETFIPGKKMSVARRKELGVNDDEEEYDLEMALGMLVFFNFL